MWEKIQYSFNDKFLSFDKEKRISWRQWFNRSGVPWLLLIIPIIILTPVLAKILIIFNPFLVLLIPIFIYIAYWILIIKFIPNLIIKRCHDFNNNGILAKKIFFVLFSTYVILVLLLITYIFTLNLTIYEIINPIINPLKIIIVIFYLYLLLRPWNKWPNNYWDDTSNIKLWLLW